MSKIISINKEETTDTEKSIMWTCPNCKHSATEGEDLLNFAIGPFLMIICPDCHVISIPDKVYAEVEKQMKSNIIKPEGDSPIISRR